MQITEIGSDIDGTYAGSYSYTVPGHARGILLAFVGDDPNDPANVTWNGTSFTQLERDAGSTSGIALYYLIAPDTGTHTFASDSGNWHSLVLASGVDTEDAIVDSGQDDNIPGGTTVSLTLNTVADGVIISGVDTRLSNEVNKSNDEQTIVSGGEATVAFIQPVGTPTDTTGYDQATEEMNMVAVSLRPLDNLGTLFF